MKALRNDYLKHKYGYQLNYLLLKLVLTIFFFGLAIKVLFFHSLSPGVSPVLEHSFPEKTTTVSEQVPHLPPVSEHVPEHEDQLSNTNTEKCDYFNGNWVPNPSGPLYTNESCNLIQSDQNCLKNGRPDREFLYWRWAPRDCDLPPFDAHKFLDAMRNKAWALIGDSITLNHVKSLLCMLSTAEQPVVTYHDEGYRTIRWHFPSCNFSLSNIWSPFLVEAAIVEDINGVPTSEIELHLDKLGNIWKDQYLNYDYIILSCGKWFLRSAIYYENDTILGCNSCSPKRNLTELGFTFAYRKALKFVLNFIASSNHKGLILYRTFTPDHFENGDWNDGTCNRTTPVKEGEMEMKYVYKMLRDIELEEFGKASVEASRNGVNLKLADFAILSLLRPDGHPGPYSQFHSFANNKGQNAKVQNDCLHWCLPGPIDTWNDILMEMVANGGIS